MTFLGARVAAAGLALRHLATAARTVKPIATVERAPAGGVTVVIPARNEAARIGPCLALLQRDPAISEVVVVDDDSVDGTGHISASYGARVVTPPPLPEGWAGKCWALQHGVAAASTEWVVTLDADTEPSVGLVGGLVARADADALDFLTVAGRFRCPTPILQMLHPSLLTTLVYRYGAPGSVAGSAPGRQMANGQCMTFRRDPFLTDGGFTPVADSLVEDVALARHRAQRGRRVAFLDAGDLLTVAMHADATQAWKGWGRSLPLGGVAGRREQTQGLAIVWLAQAMPLVRLLLRRADALDAVLLFARLGTLMGTRRAYDQPSWLYWLSPFADLPVAARLTQSTVRPERTWRGRTYPA